jgi:hypothetical protein
VCTIVRLQSSSVCSCLAGWVCRRRRADSKRRAAENSLRCTFTHEEGGTFSMCVLDSSYDISPDS